MHITRIEIKTALRDLDRHRRNGDVDRAADAYCRVRSGVETLRRYPPSTGSREADLRRNSVFTGPSRAAPDRSNGKRSSLDPLPADWQDAVQREARVEDRAPLAAMALTGCRPAEVKGIRVRQEGESISLIIRGAKYDEARGVVVRTLTFDRTDLMHSQAGRDLQEWLGNREQRTITHHGEVAAFRERVTRAAHRAGFENVSAYTYRHATARELKHSHVERSDIAARLGHRSERSQSVYG